LGSSETRQTITGVSQDPRTYCGGLKRPGEIERNRTGSQPASRFIENQKDSINKSRQPLFQGADTNGKTKGDGNVETSKGLASASTLSGAGEDTGDVRLSDVDEAMNKILDQIGEEPNPFNGNRGFKLEW
jgi:hypothetical protein